MNCLNQTADTLAFCIEILPNKGVEFKKEVNFVLSREQSYTNLTATKKVKTAIVSTEFDVSPPPLAGLRLHVELTASRLRVSSYLCSRMRWDCGSLALSIFCETFQRMFCV